MADLSSDCCSPPWLHTISRRAPAYCQHPSLPHLLPTANAQASLISVIKCSGGCHPGFRVFSWAYGVKHHSFRQMLGSLDQWEQMMKLEVLKTGRVQDRWHRSIQSRRQGHLLRTSGLMASEGPKRKCKRFRTAIRFKTNVQENPYLHSASVSVQLGRVMNGAPNGPQRLRLENNSITHQAGEI